jgi:hypothetical protein
MADRFNFGQVKKNLDQSKRELLVLLSNQAENYFTESFKKQGFGGQPWKEVKRRTEGTKAYKYPKTKGLQRRTSPILIGAGYKVRGGSLRRAVSSMARTTQISGERARMVVDLDYATYLNEGTPKMVKRQFVGQTPELLAMQKAKINEIITRIWRV